MKYSNYLELSELSKVELALVCDAIVEYGDICCSDRGNTEFIAQHHSLPPRSKETLDAC